MKCGPCSHREKVGAGGMAARSWRKRILDRRFSWKGITWMFCFEVKQVCASCGCLPVAGCVREGIRPSLLLYVSGKNYVLM